MLLVVVESTVYMSPPVETACDVLHVLEYPGAFIAPGILLEITSMFSPVPFRLACPSDISKSSRSKTAYVSTKKTSPNIAVSDPLSYIFKKQVAELESNNAI